MSPKASKVSPEASKVIPEVPKVSPKASKIIPKASKKGPQGHKNYRGDFIIYGFYIGFYYIRFGHAKKYGKTPIIPSFMCVWGFK